MITLASVLNRMEGVQDEAERRAALQIIQRTLDDGEVTEPVVLGIVRQEYKDRGDLPQMMLFARAVVYRLVFELGVLTVATTERGVALRPAKTLSYGGTVLEGMSIWPRRIILGSLAVLWLASPFDLIPDSVPVIGLVDDAVVLLACGAPILSDVLRGRSTMASLPEPPSPFNSPR